MSLSRRDLLRAASAAPFFPLLCARGAEPVPTFPGMIVRQTLPQNLEMPFTSLSDWLVPAERFYVRSHFAVPKVDAASFKLIVEGHVENRLELSLAELKRFDKTTTPLTLECAGNGRVFLVPAARGLQWANGAVGNGRWRGVRLADVLKRAGIKDSAKEILFEGADVPLGTMPDFQRSIPVKKALDANTLLAYEMNGETLPAKHGFPLRAVVPGWASDSWIKWLTSIRVLNKEHDGFWMKSAYRHPGKPVAPMAAIPPEQMQPVTSLRIKNVIASPLDRAQVLAGSPVTIRGVAWSGDASPISSVEVSVDGGRTWKPAALRADQRTQFGWRQWEFNWTPPQTAYYTILARARDMAGNTQPMDQEWNPAGYGWNVVPRIGLDVVREISAASSALPALSSDMPPAALQNACAVCHGEDVIHQQRLNRAQWDRELNKMPGWGAKLNASDRESLLDYLFSNFGPRPRGR
jgi:sulfite oxidase